jgi:phosphoribosylanthranilate isomerase
MPWRMAGMIMWPKAKRAVSDETAAAVAAAAKAGGAAAVGVFVDEDAATITQRCRQAGIPVAQLHGDASRACLNDIPEDLQVRPSNPPEDIVSPWDSSG